MWQWNNDDPFGGNAPNEDPDQDGNQFVFNLRFPGQYFDKETNLSYNYFRDYDPAIGRYIESDPIGLAAGPNTYAYVGGNPLSYYDPRGEAAQVALGCVAGAWAGPVGCGVGAAVVTIATVAGVSLLLTGDTPKQCEEKKRDRTAECNAAFGRCYNRKPNDPVHANRCAAALQQCLNTDLPVLFPHGEVVK